MTPERRSPIPGPLGRVAAAGYEREIARRNRAYDRGKGVTRLNAPVISIGNLSVGGTGKTPMVKRIVETLIDAGRTPAVAMRGYKSRGGVSDEAEEYRARFDIPIVAQPDRIAGLQQIIDDIDVIVLDDGFQHRKIARDFDIVLIDATRSPLDDRLLPAGCLREPIESLARAHAVVITHAESAPTERIEAAVLKVNDKLLVGVAQHIWSGLLDEKNQEHLVSELRGRRALAVCAIGNPGPFLDRARSAAEITGEIVLPDHDPYAAATLSRIRKEAAGADCIITTEKDWTKLRDAGLGPVFRPVLEVGFDRGWDLLRARMLEAIG